MKLLCIPLALALFVVGCGRDINNKEAVRKGVVDYLSKRTGSSGLDMSRMDVDVTDVKFAKDEAHATVSFKVKGSTDAGSGMLMPYTLERKGNEWIVKARDAAGHGGAAGMGGVMGGGAPGGEGAPAGQMPPNHPPINKPESK